MGIKNRENFIYHYKLEVSNNRCACGPGSEEDKVKAAGTIDFINTIIKKYNITSINDCACGLFNNWIKNVYLTDMIYTGFDINPLVINRNKVEYPQYTFKELDIVNEDIPYADLVICRDLLFHLPNEFVLSIIKNVRRSGTLYFLATNHRWLIRNTELNSKELENEAGFRYINLEIEPYNLGVPLEIHNEEVWRYYENGYNRQMSLWKLT